MALCDACQKPLTLRIDGEDKDEDEDEDENMDDPAAESVGNSYVDDDVHLRCGCHFHWQCLLDATYGLTSCPNCKSSIISADSNGNQYLLCNLKNEGGFQEGLDILPILAEESHLRAYPEERKSRAFLEFCAEGDVQAIVDLLSDCDEIDEDEEGTNTGVAGTNTKDVLRYQDYLGSMSSALHVAIRNQRVEIAWLLLFLASNLNLSAFPEEVLSAAKDMGVIRGDLMGKLDIRAMKDAEGMTAYDRAIIMGGIWENWVREGSLFNKPLLKAP